MNEVDRSELTAESEFLARSIEDLEAEHAAGDLADEDFAELRNEYAARAATVSRALGSRAALPVATARERSPRRTALVVVACLAVAAVAGIALKDSLGSRPAGSSITGSLPQTSSDQLARAEQLVQAGKLVDALKVYDAIIKTDPKNAAALAERGWVTHNVPGFEKQGLAYIDRAIAADPSYPEAHFFRGMIIWRDNHDPAGAVAEFRTFLANSPSGGEADTVKSLLKQAETEAGMPTQ